MNKLVALIISIFAIYLTTTISVKAENLNIMNLVNQRIQEELAKGEDKEVLIFSQKEAVSNQQKAPKKRLKSA